MRVVVEKGIKVWTGAGHLGQPSLHDTPEGSWVSKQCYLNINKSYTFLINESSSAYWYWSAFLLPYEIHLLKLLLCCWCLGGQLIPGSHRMAGHDTRNLVLLAVSPEGSLTPSGSPRWKWRCFPSRQTEGRQVLSAESPKKLNSATENLSEPCSCVQPDVGFRAKYCSKYCTVWD